jgi:hypothetical protein
MLAGRAFVVSSFVSRHHIPLKNLGDEGAASGQWNNGLLPDGSSRLILTARPSPPYHDGVQSSYRPSGLPAAATG